jgi:hypothetical protein
MAPTWSGRGVNRAAPHNDSLHISPIMLSSTLLDSIQRGPKILSIVSVASGIEEHRGLDWGLSWIFPAVSCRASGEGKPLGISQDSILEELYLVHDVRYSTKDFKRSLDDRIGIEPGMFDRYPLERGIRDDQAVRADQSKQTAVKLVSAAFVVTVQKHDFRPDLVFLPSVQVFNARETDKMFLESASCFGANALLFGPDWDPTIFPHSFENRGSRKKAVPIRNTFDRLRSEDTRS